LAGSGTPLDLAPGETLPVQLGFRTAARGEFHGMLSVLTGTGCQGFELTGLADDRAISVSPQALDFGKVPIGTNSAWQTFTIRLIGDVSSFSATLEALGKEGSFDVS